MLIFMSFSSKERFCLSSAKLRCFQHYVPENRLFLRKLCFWPFCFGVLAMRSDASRILLQKKQRFRFSIRNTLFWVSWYQKFLFLYVGNKIALLWVLYHKKSIFAFSLLKHVGFSFIAQKTCFGLFSVILRCFQCYCTKKRSFSSMQGVTLIFTWFYSNNGFAFFWLSYAVSESSFWGQPCSLFP